MSHDTLVQLFLEVQELLALTLEHLPYGDTRPARDDVGDVLGSHFLTDEGTIALRLGQLLLDRSDLGFLLLESAVADLSDATVVTAALCTLSLELELLNINLALLDAVDELLLTHPLGLVACLFFA